MCEIKYNIAHLVKLHVVECSSMGGNIAFKNVCTRKNASPHKTYHTPAVL